MTFIDDSAFYQEELLLLDQNEVTPTTITEGQVVDGDLTPFRHRIELVNTGNQLQNNGILTLRVPPDGTFRSKEPILVDETAKDDYIIQVQIKQDRDKDGVFEEEGKLFRFFIGQPTLQDDENVGETLKINLITIEYRTRETLDSERLRFETPNQAFNSRIFNYNDVKGVDNTQLLVTVSPPDAEGNPTGSIKLPVAEALKQDWRPLAPQPTHDLFREIVGRQSLAGVEGGVFEDFFFDYDAFPSATNVVVVKAEAEGTIDRGVVLDPLVFETSDTQKDNLINVDLIKFKNNTILQGNPLGGTLPRDHSVFASIFEHNKVRPVWETGKQYFDGTGDSNRSEVRITDTTLEQVRFFKAIKTTGNINVNPTTASNKEEFWTEDFVTIPEYDRFSSYNGRPDPPTTQKGDIVTQIQIGGFARFYEAIQDVPSNPQDDIIFRPQPGGTAFWEDTQVTFLIGEVHELIDPTTNTGLDRFGRTQFFSYTPWTSEFLAMRTGTLFGIEDPAQLAKFVDREYQGVVPDWNLVRANFDRVEADNRFEQVVGKDVIKTLADEPASKERYVGARFLVSPSPNSGGAYAGQANRIAEWNGSTDFKASSLSTDWVFSNFPKEDETILHQAEGVIKRWDGSSWVILWDILTTPDAPMTRATLKQIKAGLTALGVAGFVASNLISFLFDDDEFASSTRHSGLHICKDIKLVEGASGIPGQAFELRFEWSAVESIIFGLIPIPIPIPNANKMNFSSVGAWWYMPFPYPKNDAGVLEVGDIYKNSVIDSNNLDFNHNHVKGWNEGIDTEDLGRIQKVSFKARLSLFGSITAGLVIGYDDMPMVYWAVDIFDRIWFADFTLRRNGEYSFTQISFGENSIQNLHFARYDELLELFGIVLDVNWTLREKEFTGVEFDFRFVKATGMFYKIGYNSQGLYVGGQFPDYVLNVATQAFSQIFPFIASVFFAGEEFNATDLLVNNARLAIDDYRFEKQLYTNSDNEAVDNARSILTHEASEVDYLNAKTRAEAFRERKKFVEQAWFMQAHGDVRLRFGEKFVASGERVPTGTQDLICNEVKHIIDSDGYMMQLTGKRKFVFA